MNKDDNSNIYLSKFDEALLLAVFIDSLDKLLDSMRETASKVFEERK